MVTFAFVILFAMLGLVVDLGWSHFLRKSAQSAADAAALAAATAAQDVAHELSDYGCGAAVQCSPTPTYCSDIAGGNLAAACQYAALQGFTDSPEGRQRVSVQAYDRSGPPTVSENCGQAGATVFHPPTSGCVDTHYWVTVRVAERVPSLFSAILGNGERIVAARATAGVVQTMIHGSLILINREMDPWNPRMKAGINLYNSGGPEVTVPGGIILASQAHGPGIPQDPWAGFVSGSGVVNTVNSSTPFRGDGRYAISGGGEWLGNQSYNADAEFDDPMRGYPQPPLTEAALPMKAVPGGTLDPARDCGGSICPSAVYYATDATKQIATGEQIVINSNVTFKDTGFGDFYFLGGLKIGGTTVEFGPGRYGVFGVKDPARTILFEADNRATLLSTPGNDAGRIFILSDSLYSDRLTELIDNIPGTLSWGGPNQDTLFFAKSSIKAGNNAASRVMLQGLDKDLLPVEELKDYQSVVIWQDRRNSYVGYDDTGVDLSCGDLTLNSPCAGGVAPPSDSPQLEIWATPYSQFRGTIYQPRGAWTFIQAAGDYIGPLRIISGAMELQGTGRLTLTGDAPPIVSYTSALVE